MSGTWCQHLQPSSALAEADTRIKTKVWQSLLQAQWCKSLPSHQSLHQEWKSLKVLPRPQIEPNLSRPPYSIAFWPTESPSWVMEQWMVSLSHMGRLVPAFVRNLLQPSAWVTLDLGYPSLLDHPTTMQALLSQSWSTAVHLSASSYQQLVSLQVASQHKEPWT